MQDALVESPVAEEAHCHPAVAKHLRSQRGARGKADAASHDAVGPEDAAAHVGDVHGPAPAPAVPGDLAHQLGHAVLLVGAFGKHMGVPAMGGGDVVVAIQRPYGADGDGLLALVGMGDAADAPGAVEGGGTLLELADEAHPPVHPAQLLGGQPGDLRERGVLQAGDGASKCRSGRLSKRSGHAASWLSSADGRQ